MVLKLLLLFLFIKFVASINDSFLYQGFRGAHISLNGIAGVTPNGLLRLTNDTRQAKGRAFHSTPLHFINSSNGKALSFSTSFVFAMTSKYPNLTGNGMAFVISPSKDLPGAFGSQYLGLFNSENNGNETNHVFAVELDTNQNTEFGDINNNHVGIDINSLRSSISAPATYISNENGRTENLTLMSGQPMQVWIEYNGVDTQLNVTLSPIHITKPSKPLMSATIDLSSIFEEAMYAGFSSSTGSFWTSHYVLGWSFSMSGTTKTIDVSKLPLLPRTGPKEKSEFLTIGLPAIVLVTVLMIISGVGWFVRRKMKFAELLEDWENEYGPHRFSYKDLFIATKGFKDKELLGFGGFGRVYRGVLPRTKIEVAVKKVSHESRQGMREFVAEIVSIGRLRHRNLVQLLGYCRRKGELLLVYDFMPNGSLDKLLFDQPKSILNWSQRFRIIKGVASGLLYLHEQWEQVVIHRDVKASNVLLDADLNGRLGDFGLARLYNHGTDPRITLVVGTYGYLAPELARTSKATTSTDVFAFGVFMLEVACGKRPIEKLASEDDLLLVDFVLQCWKRGSILETCDQNLVGDYDVEEMELVLTLGLICSHPISAFRPTMLQVKQMLDRDKNLPEFPLDSFNAGSLAIGKEDFDDLVISSVAESLLSGGR